MAANDPWNSSFEANPTNSDDAGQGDDEILETRQRHRYRAQREVDVGDSSIDAAYSDTGRMIVGSARPFFQSTAPTTLLKADGSTAQTATIGGVGASLGANDDGRLWLLDSTGAYQLFGWDDSVSSDPTYGKFRPINNIDPSTMHSFNQLEDSVSVPGTAAVINGTTSAGGASSDLEVSVTPPTNGIWCIHVWWAHSVVFGLSGPSGQVTGSCFVDVSGGATTRWPGGVFQINSASGGQDLRSSSAGHRIIANVTGGTAYTFQLWHDLSTASGGSAITQGDADSGALTGGFVTHIEALVMPYGI